MSGFFGDAFLTTYPSGSDLALNVRVITSASSPIDARLVGTTDNGATNTVKIDESRYLRVNVSEPRTAFGELSTANNTPLFQADFVYGFSSASFAKLEIDPASDSVFFSGSMIGVKCGTTSGSIVSVKTAQSLKYRSGQGALARMTAMLSSVQSGTAHAWGVGDQENGFFFTRLGSDLGGGLYLGHKNGARKEIVRLTLSAASTTNENLTVRLGGSGTLVAVTNNASLIQTANQIAAGDYSSYLGGWDAQSSGSTVTFVSKLAKYWGAVTTYSIIATSATGSYTKLQSGRTVTTTLISQSQWNVDTMDGNGPSGMTVNPEKGNIYAIRYGYLGFYGADFLIAHDTDGEFSLVHSLRAINTSSQTTLENPSMPIFWTSNNYLANVTGSAIYGASCAGFIQGPIVRNGTKKSALSAKTGVGTTYTNILTLRNPIFFHDRVNKAEMFFHMLSAAAEGTKPSGFVILKNATLGGVPTWTEVDNGNSIAHADTAATTVTGGNLVFATSLGKSSNITIDLKDFEIFLAPGETITVAAKTGASTADINTSLSWVEDW